MNFTTGHEKTFLDSNILIYLVSSDESKKEKSTILLNPRFYISTQVVAENINVCLRKFKLTKDKAYNHGNFLLSKFNLITIEKSFFPIAFQLSKKYQFSFWDSLIVATALQSDCSLLYSEDMHDGLIVEDKLRSLILSTNQ
jgi:predicted nucleic acid-binding protein